MKKIFFTLAVLVMAICASAQKNQYFWYQGNLMMGNPIAQIDSVTFGEGEPADTLHILLPRTIIKEVHDTVYITIHDTVCPGENMYKGHEYVDLGLPSGLLWATCNLEAPAPEQPGGDFAWGEIASRDASSFSSSSYLYANNPIQLNDIGGTEYDAATMKWGAEWRMPTYDEIWELMSNTTLSSDVINGYNVLVFTAQNGKSMILPKNAFDNTWGGFYSSTSAGANTAYRGWEFDKGYISYNWRWEGSQIRPVVSGSVINQ